jgi:uncharacterized protein YggE
MRRKAVVRVRALEAAREKARAMTEALGDVVTIVEGDSHTNAAVGVGSYLERSAVDKAPDAPAPPGAIPLSTSVTVVYRLR